MRLALRAVEPLEGPGRVFYERVEVSELRPPPPTKNEPLSVRCLMVFTPALNTVQEGPGNGHEKGGSHPLDEFLKGFEGALL